MHTKPRYSLIAALCFVVALFCIVYPIFVSMPFHRQRDGEVLFSLGIVRYRWIVLAVVGLAAAWAWGRTRRLGPALALLGVIACAALTRVNIFEVIFHPVDAPEFASTGETKLAGDEKVIAIAARGRARAYPIRGLSYHHVVNDTVGGVPLAATY